MKSIRRSGYKKAERAKVLYSYEAENEDELSMETGDIITILDKELEDAGWWKGEINGRIGVFPDNFVELLVVEEKPKKPPPPSLPPNKAKERPPPPDPTKTDQSKTHKKEDHKEEKPTKPTVPPLGKKPSAPPPVGKKPLKGADPKLIAQTDDHKAKEQKADSFDSVESTSEKLNHVTLNRVKVPSVRRPPSIRKEEANDPLDTPVKEEEIITESPPATSQDKRRSRSKRLSASPGEHRDRDSEAKTEEPKVPSTRSVKAPPPVPRDNVTSPVASTRPVSITRSVVPEELVSDESRGAASTVRIDELQKELDQMKETHVTRGQYDELQGEVKQLKQAMEQMKSQFNKRLYELMGEIDEEKKIRLSTQVEIDRLKTLVRS